MLSAQNNDGKAFRDEAQTAAANPLIYCNATTLQLKLNIEV